MSDDDPDPEDDPGCDTSNPLAADHPSGPALDSTIPLPDPGDEEAWTRKL